MHSCPAIDRRRFLALGGAGLLAAAAAPLLPDRAFAQQSAPGGTAFRSDLGHLLTRHDGRRTHVKWP